MITNQILEQMAKVRESGFANIFSRSEVMDTANRLELTELFIWLLVNKKYYGDLLIAFEEYSKNGKSPD